MNRYRKAIAIDFDGCLFEDKWPEIGAPNMEVIKAAIREKENGAGLILWSCRIGEELNRAIEICRSYGLEFDAVNQNLPERIEAYGVDCRKVNADEYWDDRSVRKQFGFTSEPVEVVTVEDVERLRNGFHDLREKKMKEMQNAKDLAITVTQLDRAFDKLVERKHTAYCLDAERQNGPSI